MKRKSLKNRDFPISCVHPKSRNTISVIAYLLWLLLLEPELLLHLIMTEKLAQERQHRGQLRENLSTLALTGQWLNIIWEKKK